MMFIYHMCQTPSKTQTDGQTDGRTKRRVSSSVRLLCLAGASILWGNEPRCFIEI